MKHRIFTGCTLLLVIFVQGQNINLNNVQGLLDKGEFNIAIEGLSNFEANTSLQQDERAALFYFLKAQAFQKLYEKNIESHMLFKKSGTAYNNLFDVEKKRNLVKYTNQAKPLFDSLIQTAFDKAISYQNTRNYIEASQILHDIYTIQPENPEILYFAASNATAGKNYDVALKYYQELRSLGYTGVKNLYFAKERSTGRQLKFPDEITRDSAIKSGSYSDASQSKTMSRLPEILKNLSWIYLNIAGDYQQALAIINEAIQLSPEDNALLVSKGNIYYQMGNEIKFLELMQILVAKDPNDVDSRYNIGVVKQRNQELEEARVAFRKVLEIDPSYLKAAINLSKSYIDEASQIADKMNLLENNSSEDKTFKSLQAQQIALYKKSVVVLENISNKHPKNISVLKQLVGLYSFFNEDTKLEVVKAKLLELEN